MPLKKNTILKFTVICCFYLSASTLYAQNRTIDSLESLLNEAKDTARICVLKNMVWEYRGVNPEKSIYYSKEAILLAEKFNNPKEKAHILQYLGVVHNRLGKYNKAIDYFTKALNLGNTINDSVRIATSLGSIGNSYGYLGDIKTSMSYIEKAIIISEKIGHKTLLAGNLSNMAASYYTLGQIDKALDYFLKALKINEELNDLPNISMLLSNVAAIYSSMNNFKKTKEYLIKALEIQENLNDKRGMAFCLNNLSSVFYEEKNFKSALDYSNRAIKLQEEIDDRKGLSESYNILSIIYRQHNDFSKALEYDSKALKIRREIGDKAGLAETYCNMGKSYRALGDNKNSTIALNKSIEIASQVGDKKQISETYKELAATLFNKGDFKEAFLNYQRYSNLKDSIYTENTQKQFSEMQTKYETEKKEKEIELLEKDKKLQITEVKSQRQQKYAFIGGFVLMMVLAVVIFKSYRDKKKANILLAEQKHEIEEKNDELNQQNEEIRTQRDEIELQKHIIEERNLEVMDSIYYAQRIQRAMLPSEEYISSLWNNEYHTSTSLVCQLTNEQSNLEIQNFFILFKPKDIVSGDFYWIARRHNWVLIAVADCTGHGVPGAFMSMLGISFLNEIVARDDVQTAGQTLDELRKYIIKSLQQKGISGEQKDGMDIAFVALNTETMEILYAGANNPLYNVETGGSPVSTLREIRPDKMPVAIHENMPLFTNHTLKVRPGDILYLSTDGFGDQFGGPKGKKFYEKQLKEMLLVNSHLSMVEQKEILDKTIEDWKNGYNEKYEQTDDITILGFKPKRIFKVNNYVILPEGY
ncbi:MAG: tetratricopeptide repeat protein [Bacteroidia bacterium]|nr:tetratricopeptide repeat protein [Bacteroidia bacterium]